MSTSRYGVAAIVATMGVAAAVLAAPSATADECDPSVAVCDGGDVQTDNNPSMDFSPSVSAPQYPDDDDWYFNPAGGGTALQPEHPAGGGGHR